MNVQQLKHSQQEVGEGGSCHFPQQTLSWCRSLPEKEEVGQEACAAGKEGRRGRSFVVTAPRE